MKHNLPISHLPPKKRQRAIYYNKEEPVSGQEIKSEAPFINNIINESIKTEPGINIISNLTNVTAETPIHIDPVEFIKTEDKSKSFKVKLVDVLWRRRELMKKHRLAVIKYFETLKKIGKTSYFHKPLNIDFKKEYKNWKKNEQTIEDIRLITTQTFDLFQIQFKNNKWLKSLSEKEIKNLDFVLSGQISTESIFVSEDKSLWTIEICDILEIIEKWHKISREIFCCYVEYQIKENNEKKQVEANRSVLYIDVFFTKAKELLKNLQIKLNSEIKQLKIDEQLDRVDKENREPALKTWIKQPLPPRKFKIIKEYDIVKGLTDNEITKIKQSFKANDYISLSNDNNSNKQIQTQTQWVMPDGLGDEDLINEQEFVNKKVKTKCDLKMENPWEPCLVGKDINVKETWGIDCWVRKNIALALETVPENFRMTPPQINWFIEGLILRNTVRQSTKDAHDIGVTLNLLAATAQQEKLNQIEVVRLNGRRNRTISSSEEAKLNDMYSKKYGQQSKAYHVKEEVIGKAIKVYRTKLLQWHAGFVTMYNEKTQKHEVNFEDGTSEMLNLAKERINFPQLQTTKYDKDVTPDMILQAVDAILRFRDNWSLVGFAIHPKGLGVVAEIDLFKGEFIGCYYGTIYPPWLWERKEQAEDKLRQKQGIKLPDFWNIRFERPDKCTKGYDILYIDAKSKGSVMSRLNHSCSPNCVVMMIRTCESGDCRFKVAVRAARDIEDGEELTIDYNCVTDSVEEFRAAVCLCGSNACRGSFLYLTEHNQFMQVVNRRHRVGHRLAMLLEACQQINAINGAKEIELNHQQSRQLKEAIFEGSDDKLQVRNIGDLNLKRLVKHNIGNAVLHNFAAWLGRYLSLCLRFADIEALELPSRIFADEKKRRKALHKKNHATKDFVFDSEKAFEYSKVQAKGILGQREANLVITAGKVRSRIVRRLRSGRLRNETLGDKECGVLFAEDKFENPDADQICSFVLDDLISIVEQEASIVEVPKYKTRRKDVQLRPRFVVKSKKLPAVKVNVADILQDCAANGKGRRYWVGDRVLAKWCADDYRLYPGWYEATVLAVYPSRSSKHIRTNEQKNETQGNVVEAVMSEMLFKLETYEYIEDSNAYLERGDLENIAINELSKKWQGPSVHVLYDTGETDRIPLNQSFIFRPKSDNVETQNNPLTGLQLSTHQAPLRVLNKLEILYCLVKDKERSILSRLLVLLEGKLGKHLPVWQQSIKTIRTAYGPNRHLPFWWNLETKEIRILKPKEAIQKKQVWYIPKLLRSLKAFYSETLNTATSYEDALEVVKTFRETITKLPLPSLKNSTKADRETLNNELQMIIDVLTMVLHTTTFFTVTEPRSTNLQGNNRSVISALLGWLDQKEENLDIYSLPGIGFIPNVEACFSKKDHSESQPQASTYINHSRSSLITHLSHKEFRYNNWPKEVANSFNETRPMLTSELQQIWLKDDAKTNNLWPPPAPPPFLFGSPVIDAATLDNFDLTRLSSRLTGNVTDTGCRTLLDSLKRPVSNRSKQVFAALLQDIKTTVRKTKFEDWLSAPELTAETQRALEDAQYNSTNTTYELLKLKPIVVSTLSRQDPIKSCLNNLIQKIESNELLKYNKEQNLFPSFFEHFKISLNFDFRAIKNLWKALSHEDRVLWGQQCQAKRWRKSE